MKASSYLELSWLAKPDKDILLPPVIFAEIEYSGFWCYPNKKEYLIDNEFYPLDRGLIVIEDTLSNEEIEACIAHEWRHCWQFHQGWMEGYFPWDFNSPLSYEEKVVEYYISNPKEMDALVFALNKCSCEHDKQDYEWIIKR